MKISKEIKRIIFSAAAGFLAGRYIAKRSENRYTLKEAYAKIKSTERHYENRTRDSAKLINGWINLKSNVGPGNAYKMSHLVTNLRISLRWNENNNYIFRHHDIPAREYMTPSHWAWRNNDNLPCSKQIAFDQMHDLPF